MPRRPGFSAAVLMSIAMATAVLLTVAAVVDHVLVRPLPFSGAARIATIWFSSPNLPGGLSRVRQSKATYTHVLRRGQVFEAFALAEEAALTLDTGDRPARIRGAQVTADLFDVLNIAAARGRRLLPSDDLPGAPPVVVLSAGMWRSRFGGADDIVGRTVRLDGVNYAIVGVLDPSVRFPASDTEVWVPLTVDPASLAPQDFVYTGYGRLREGVTPDGAREDLARLIDELPDAYPATFPRALIARLKLSGLVVPLLDELVGPVRRPLIFALMASLAMLLAVGANVTNLFVARQESRQLDMAVRSALGAGRGRLARGLIVDASAHAIVGGTIGVIIAAGLLRWVRQAAASVLPRASDLGIDARTAFAVLGAVTVMGAVIGLITVWRAQPGNMAGLYGAGRSLGSRRAVRLRWWLVGAQVAAAVVILTGAGLLVRSTVALGRIDPGFRAEGLTGARLFLPASDYASFDRVIAFYRDLVDDLRATPGIQGASAATFLPLRDGRIFYPYRLEGNAATDQLPVPLLTKLVLDGYFETMGTPMLEGRSLDRHDLDAGTDVAVVSAAFAAAYWPGESSVGKRLRYDANGPWHTIVGVAANVTDRQIADPPLAMVYLPYQQRHATDRRWRELSLTVRASSDALAGSALLDLVARRDRAIPVYDIQPAPATVAAASARTRYAMLLIVFCAISALVVAAIGIYGVLSHVVAGRTPELALRLALGALPSELRALILRDVGITMIVGGVIGGLVSALTLRLVSGLLYGVQPGDPVTIILVGALLGGVGWIATLGPARRAAATPPADLLRSPNHS
jgi:putative ABC transport system permease protein